MLNNCNICFDFIDNEIFQCKIKCNSFYHLSCAKNCACKVNTCPFCRSKDFYELPNLNQFYEYCQKDNLEEIKKLNLNIEDRRSDDNFALFLASNNGHLEVVKFLIDNGLTLEDIRNQDNFAFRWASFSGYLEVVKYLINQGLTLEDIRSHDNEAFRWASNNGHLEVVKYLIDKGLTLEDIRSIDNLALRWASRNGHLEVVKYLEEIILIYKVEL